MNTIIDLIKNTPIVTIKIDNTTIHCKCEYLLPGGSIKDRSALECINLAKQNGLLKEQQAVVEMTSGNMGAGLAIVCKALGHPFIAFMSEGNSTQRKLQMERFGAKVITIPQIDGSPGKVTGKDILAAAKCAQDFALSNNAHYVDQFNNEGSVLAHYCNTGIEIINQLGEVTKFFACSIGSSGSFTGISKRLKEFRNSIKCFAVEPEGCEIISGKNVTKSTHVLQGSGYGIIPPKFNYSLCDGFVSASDAECIVMKEKLARDHGIYVGFTAAANVIGCIKLSKSIGIKDGFTTILCDSGFKYE